MLNSCKVRRNTRTREIDQVVIDRPFTDERANVIYNYYRSIGIPIHLGKEAMRKELEKRGFNVDLEVAAWHGSPHSFVRFLLEKIGIGEGAQRFGWGLYFTELEDIARQYANKLATPSETLRRLKAILWDKKEIVDLITIEQSSIKGLLEFKKAIFGTAEVEIKGNSFLTIEERKYLEKESNNEKLSTEDRSQLQKYLYIDNIIADFYNALDSTRNLYRVTLHKGKDPSEYTWLEWDKSVPKTVLDKIANGFETLFGENISIGEPKTGEEVYDAVIDVMSRNRSRLESKYGADVWGRADKLASLFLLENGIDGVKYPAESISRGATSDTARGFNYVVFDENAITIEEHIQFLSTPSGEVYGFVTPEGEMFLDPDVAGVNTLVHEGAHIQYKVLKTAAERGDFKAQAILNKIQELTAPAVETIFNAKKAQERGSDSMSSVDMQIRRKGSTRKLAVFTKRHLEKGNLQKAKEALENYTGRTLPLSPTFEELESIVTEIENGEELDNLPYNLIEEDYGVSEKDIREVFDLYSKKYDKEVASNNINFQISQQPSPIFDSEGNLNIEELNRIVENNLITTNLTENEKEGLRRASKYALGLFIISREAEKKRATDGQELVEETTRRAIEDYSRAQQKIWSQERINQNYDYFSEGSESVVYKSKDGTHVLKQKNVEEIELTYTPTDFIKNRVILYNTLFPDSTYEIVGITEQGDFLLKQDFVEGKTLTELFLDEEIQTREEVLEIIDKEVKRRFEVEREDRGVYFTKDYIIADINEYNIVQTTDGRFIIDAITVTNNQNRAPLSIEIEQDLDFQIIGEQGAQRVQEYADSLSKAKELEQEGIPYDQIETQTGWYKYEGQWRTIPSEVLQNFKIQNYDKNTRLQLSEVLGTENVLFDLYPELKEITVVFVEENQPNTPKDLPQGFENSAGVFEEATQSIFIPTMVQEGGETSSRTDEETSRLLAHEVNHVVQLLEEFPVGGDEYSVIFEAGDIIGVDFSNKSFRFIIGSIDSTDTSKLTDNERRILIAAKQSTRSFMGGIRDTTFRNYQHILGEIDSRIVEKALELHQQGQTIVNYSEALQLVEIQDNLDLNNIFLLRNGGVRFSLVEPQLAFEAAELSSPAYNQREGETDEQYKERLTEEVFTRALGDNAEQYLKDLGFTTQEAKTFLQKVQEFLAEIVDWLRGKKGLQDLSVDEINQLSIREFLDRSTTSMMLGEFRGNVLGQAETPTQDSFYRESDFNPDGTVKESVLQEIAEERRQIEEEAKANGTWMKAPNGNPTNLNEEQWVQVRTQRFKDWFGDWQNDPQNASKVVDENGEPMVIQGVFINSEYKITEEC